MSLEEDRITNLLYLISQIHSIEISDKTANEKKWTIMQMADLGLLKHVGGNRYSLDVLGQGIVNSKKSYSQYLEMQKIADTANLEINQPAKPSQKNRVKVFVIMIIFIALFLTYWLGFKNS